MKLNKIETNKIKTNKTKAILLIAVFILSTIAYAIPFASATATLTSSATGDVSADTYYDANPAELLSPIVITLGAGSDMPANPYEFEIVGGDFVFDTSSTPVLTVTGTGTLQVGLTEITETKITITVTTGNAVDDILTISGIKVRTTTRTLPNIGEITGTDIGGVTDFGTLTMVLGVPETYYVDDGTDYFVDTTLSLATLTLTVTGGTFTEADEGDAMEFITDGDVYVGVTKIVTVSSATVVVLAANPGISNNDKYNLVDLDVHSVGDPFRYIQSAITIAGTGDTISVADGDYTEDIDVNKATLTIKGESLNAIVTGGFYLAHDDITIDGLTIIGGYDPDEANPDSAVYTESAVTGATIINNKLIGPGPGPGNGIYLHGGVTGYLIDNNEITNWKMGIYGNVPGSGTITRNEIHNNLKTGIELDSPARDSIVIKNNNIYDNTEYGIALLHSTPGFGETGYFTPYLDITLNWWGQPSEPTVNLGTTYDIYLDTADGDTSEVIYSPWLALPIAYADVELTVNPYLEDDYYNLGEIVNVIVYDDSENDRPLLVETVEVVIASDVPDQIIITLTETGLNTATFQGTFTLVDELVPGPTELLVVDMTAITLVYDSDTITDTDTATVDSTDPTIEPTSEEYTPNLVTRIATAVPTIDVTIDDATSKLASVTMTLDGETIFLDSYTSQETEEAIPISYTVPTYDLLSEDTHTVQVLVSDVAGNIATKTWSFIVDLTKPTVTVALGEDEDPANAGPIVFTLTFSEDMDTEVDPVVTFGADSPYTGDTANVGGVWTADIATEYTVGITVTTEMDEGVNTIKVSAGADEAGNEMLEDVLTTFTIDTTAPVAPSDIVETVTDVSIQLDWTAATDVDGTGVETYDIYRSLVIGNYPITALVSLDSSITTYTDYSAFVEGTYYYKLTAVDFAGNEASAIVDVDFDPGDVIAREISLSTGWNLISLPLIPDDSSITVILADVMENVEIVWGYKDNTWSSYLPAVPEFSTLTELVDGEGYWVKMTAADSVIVYGVELPGPGVLPPVYDVSEGWNLIGFKSVEPMSINGYLTTIPLTVRESSVSYGWDATSQGYELVYLAGDPIPDDDTKFISGYGYWLYLTEDASIAPPTYDPEA